jgi:hypothetical protein
MVDYIQCSHCGLVLDVPEEEQEPWPPCPRCGSGGMTPVEPDATGQKPFTVLGLCGMLVCVAGAVGLTLGWGLILWSRGPQIGRGGPGTVPSILEQVLLNGLAFTFVIAAGVILIHAAEQPSRRMLLVVAAVGALVSAMLLLIFSGLIAFFAACCRQLPGA